jgi:hypothetical protein
VTGCELRKTFSRLGGAALRRVRRGLGLASRFGLLPAHPLGDREQQERDAGQIVEAQGTPAPDF